MVRLCSLLALLLFTALNLAGCGRTEEPVRIFTSQVAVTAPEAPENQGLIFAVACEDEPVLTYEAYRPLVEYLSRTTGVPVELSIKGNSALVEDMLRNGDADLARISAGSYTKISQSQNLEILALESLGGSSQFQAVIIVRKDSPCQSFEHLRGKSFALVDRTSASGYEYPLFLVGERGADLAGYFSDLRFSGSHGRSIMAVYDGAVDGACVASYILERELSIHPELAKAFRIIGRSPDLTRGPLVAGPYLGVEQRTAINQALTGMSADEEGRAVLAGLGLDEFRNGTEADYSPNRTLLAAIEPGVGDDPGNGPGTQ